MSENGEDIPVEEVPQEEVVPQEEEIVEQLRKEAQDFKDKYLRSLAELENSRKRLAREKIESQSYAIQNVILDLLPPLDHFEQALAHAENAETTISGWAKGFEMILQQLKQVLSDHGVTPFDSVGELFDPHLHEAVETETRDDIPEGTVTFEFHKGYKLGSRIIRAARVRVATKAKENNGPQEQNEQIKEG